MKSKNKEENQTFMPINQLSDKSSISEKIKQSKFKSLSSSNTPKVKIQISKNKKNKRLNQIRKERGFSDFSSVNLVNQIKRVKYSCSSPTNLIKSFSRLPSGCKSPKMIKIKTLENSIKQKIIDMSSKLEKNDISFSENENSDNCNFIMPLLPANKTIKKFNSESGHESSSQSCFVSKKEDKKKSSNLSFSKKSTNKKYFKKEFNKKAKEKIFRKIDRKNIIYDSIDDSDIFYERNKIGFYIQSNSIFALIFDSLILLCALFDVIYTPFHISKTVCFCMNTSKKIKYIYNWIDLLYFSDLVFSFFRFHYNKNLKIIKDNEIIIKNYIASQFTIDFLEAIPIFSIILFLCKNNDDYCEEYFFTFKQSLSLFCCFFKQIKLIKIIDKKKNSLTNKILNIISRKYNIEEKYTIFKWTIVSLHAIYIFISIHIFIGRLSYPNWITYTNLQNKNYFSLYISSFYFLLATVTTVGYGDIVCKSNIEINFQIVFLAVGVCVYSWIVSNVGNYVKNQDYAAIKCNKDERLLEEIRIEYPEMPFKLYHQILQHLKSRKLRQQKCDVNILINSLPYSLRNNLLLTMYKQTTDRLKICKNCSNSDFTIKLLKSFIPLFSKKNGLIIHEGELIESIVFVNDGRLALEASIDLEYPENSVFQYLNLSFKDINELGGSTTGYMDSSSTCSHITLQNFLDYKKAENYLDKVINSSNIKSNASGLDETSIGRQIGKYDYDGNFDESNYKYINIINILKNESYGSVYMFLDKPSPLSLRVKSKKAELFLLRKFDAFAISRLHSNIWKRFQNKAYLNMVSIKNATIRIIKNYSKKNGIRPIQRKQNRDFTVHFGSNYYRDSLKGSNKNVICFSNSSSNYKSKTNLLTIDKETANFGDKEQNNDLMANINKVINNKKNDNINEIQNKDMNFNLKEEVSKEINKNIKNEENTEIPHISINIISPKNQNLNQNDNTNNRSLSSKKSSFLHIRNLNNQTFSGGIVLKRRISSSNANTNSFFIGQKKNMNFEISPGNQNESKRGSSELYTGIFSFGDKCKSTDKNETIGNEKMEKISDFAYNLHNQTNKELKSTRMPNIPSIINKKRTKTRKINSASSVNSIGKVQKNKLNHIGKIRLRFVRKLTKIIKKLKKEKNKYKAISKSLTQDFNEFVKGQTTKEGDTNIKNTKTLDDTENKKIIYNIKNKTKSKIQNQNNIITKNNIINNVTVHNNNKFLVQIPEFSASDSSEEISSDTHSKTFDLSEITISPSVRFMCKSKYKNLNIISLGYFTKSKKLRKSVRNVIKEFLSVKKQITHEEELKISKKEILYKKQKTNSSKTDSLNEYPFQIYTDNVSKNIKQSNNKKNNRPLQINQSSYNSSNGIKRSKSTNINKTYNYEKNIENKNNNYYNNQDNSNDNSQDISHDNSQDNNDNNYYTFLVNVPKNQDQGYTNIIKLKNMNYLSISPSLKAVKSSSYKKKKNKQKKCNNTEYEFEHVFSKNNNILKKSCSVKEKNDNIKKISSSNFFYIRDRTKYRIGKEMKIEDADKSIKDKSSNNLNLNNKNETEEIKSLNNKNCYIF